MITPRLTQDLQTWQNLRKQADELRARLDSLNVAERQLRSTIAHEAFAEVPRPLGSLEGTHTLDLGAGWKLKAGFKIKREVDEATLPDIKVRLQQQLINPDTLFRYKPALNVKAYRQLTAEAQKLVDSALEIRPELPDLELIAPKDG